MDRINAVTLATPPDIDQSTVTGPQAYAQFPVDAVAVFPASSVSAGKALGSVQLKLCASIASLVRAATNNIGA